MLIPLVLVLGAEWGATGAGGAVLASTAVFCLVWVVLLARIKRAGGGMRVLIVSGIWPPDVGGPASHAPELAAFLPRARPRGRGRDDGRRGACTGARIRVDWVSRRLPVGVRHAAVAEKIRSRARGADVVYATGMFGRARSRARPRPGGRS